MIDFNENDFKNLKSLAETGKIQIGVHTEKAANFFNKNKKEMIELIGEPITLQRYSLLIIMYSFAIIFFVNIFFAIKGFGWMSIIAIALSTSVYALRSVYARMKKQRIISSIIFLTVLIFLALFLSSVIWIKLFFISIFILIFLNKLRYYLAYRFMQQLVTYNYKAYKLLNGETISLRDV